MPEGRVNLNSRASKAYSKVFKVCLKVLQRDYRVPAACFKVLLKYA